MGRAGAAVGLLPFLITLTWVMMHHTNFRGWPALVAIAALLVFPLTMAYVIVVHRAMDVRVAVRQGLQYLLATTGIRILQIAAQTYGIDLSTPFEQLPRKTQNLILYGPDASEKKRGGFLGIFAYLRQAMEESTSETYREWLLDHMSATTCPACHGLTCDLTAACVSAHSPG